MALCKHRMHVQHAGCIPHARQEELNAAADTLIYCTHRATVYPVISGQNKGQIPAIRSVIDFYRSTQPKGMKWGVNKLSLDPWHDTSDNNTCPISFFFTLERTNKMQSYQ